MDIEEIRLTRSEIDTIQIPAGYEVEVDEIIANTATDKAIRKMVEYLDSHKIASFSVSLGIGEVVSLKVADIEALKELIDTPPQATG